MNGVPDSRVSGAIGRGARLELTFEARGGRTIATHAYAEPPFRIGATFDVDRAAYLILACSGPGVFGGDALRLAIDVRSGARVVLTSQAALQVHPSITPAPAIVRHEYHVEEDGELHCHWDPVIPFATARLDQRFDLEIEAGARLYWSDALMSGRAMRGEAWRFGELAHELGLRVAGALRYLERYRLAPCERPPDRPWIAGTANYTATTLVYHDRSTHQAAETLQARLAALDGVDGGADLADERLLVVRLTAARGTPFGAARRTVRQFAVGSIFNRPQLVDRK